MSTEVETTTKTSNNDGDHDRFSHYADKDEVTRAFVFGTPVTALCGKVWVPSRDPSKYPICPACKRVYELLGGSSDSQ